ncbi:DUF2000 domain-containing protein [Marinitenerispora sediminis]|uniref:DUF2000 domain-containing protein n=1 Tax=Marinitenerispora sediminis TaxID=1931232 RepID=A0A368T033_9ACTN|nr:DUF2000 domain-containing protein [Marinitenerispora sediminis]RCV51450.1 DUF2000 domain-containing protein [Marinitenerispora sediminis]RCV51910.1 DUF2000 domain-containing protein [Marinitenerispora sediminis]RCV55252.1 DUF2000 domain-containing protein [Marinitenerispora sediminis]
MRFDTKMAIVVREDLAAWQKLNVTAFLAGGAGSDVDSLVGKPYEDGSGNRYLPLIGQPVVVHSAGAEQLARAWERAVARGLRVGVYTEELFGTDNDEDNRAAVRAVPAEELRLVGIAVYGPRNSVAAALKRLPLHG